MLPASITRAPGLHTIAGSGSGDEAMLLVLGVVLLIGITAVVVARRGRRPPPGPGEDQMA